MNTNIPTTLLTNFALTLQGLERHLTGHLVPDQVSTFATTRDDGSQLLRARFAQNKLGLGIDECRRLRKVYSKRKLKSLFDEALRLQCAFFRAARIDYIEGRGAQGCFALAPKRNRGEGRGQIGHLRRLTRLMGRDPNKLKQTELTMEAFELLSKLEFNFTVGGKVHEGKGMVRVLGTKKVKGRIDGEHKGGPWWFVEIHPELFALSLNRFTPLSDTIFECPTNKDFRLAARMCAQATLKRSTDVSIDVERALRDSGLIETTTRGHARSIKRMLLSLARMVELGILTAFEMVGDKLSTTFAALPGHEHQVCCDSDSGTPSLSQTSKKKSKKQGLTGLEVALVRILRKMSSTDPPPLEGGGRPDEEAWLGLLREMKQHTMAQSGA